MMMALSVQALKNAKASKSLGPNSSNICVPNYLQNRANDHACLYFRQDFYKLANFIIPELGILFTALNLQMIGIIVLCLLEYALISFLELPVTHHPSLCQTLTQCCCNGGLDK